MLQVVIHTMFHQVNTFWFMNQASNEWRFKRPNNLTSSLDYFMNQSGSLVQFSSSNFVILKNK